MMAHVLETREEGGDEGREQQKLEKRNVDVPPRLKRLLSAARDAEAMDLPIFFFFLPQQIDERATPKGDKSSGYFVALDREANFNFLPSERHSTAPISLAWFFCLTFGPLGNSVSGGVVQNPLRGDPCPSVATVM